MGLERQVAAGTKVRISESMDVPHWSEWEDDKGRTSVPTKRRLQQLFFRGDKKVNGEVVYIAKESEREGLRRLGQVKVRVREASGATVTITVEASKLVQA
jgi:hypothetical protein